MYGFKRIKFTKHISIHEPIEIYFKLENKWYKTYSTIREFCLLLTPGRNKFSELDNKLIIN